MSEDCRNDCMETFEFPRAIFNRPGLKQIEYRVGTYSIMIESMLRRLDKDDVLSVWTHREGDDPGIALLEGAAILGDILTQYQEVYANEAFLRTAQWRESIADLVRLLGYRLSPGVGGAATFAFAIRGENSVIIPKGFVIKAQLDGQDEKVDFETQQEITAFPPLSQFNLYRPRIPAGSITAGLNQLEIKSVDGANDLASTAALDIQEGDRIMLVPSAKIWDITGTSYQSQNKAEILIVKEVNQVLDRTILTFAGSLTVSRGSQVKAYRLGRSFRHFGHNAPAQLTKLDANSGNSVQSATSFKRDIYDTHSPTGVDRDFYPRLEVTAMPLDQEVDDLAEGAPLICQGMTSFTGQDTPVRFTVVKTIQNVEPDSLVWGNLSGSTTVVTINQKLIANDDIINEKADIRSLRFQEVTSPEIILRAPSQWNSGPFTGQLLKYFGKYSDALSLAGRELLFERVDGETQIVSTTDEPSDFSLNGRDKKQDWLWTIHLDQEPSPFLYQDFDEENSTVTVYGNLVKADQGKTEKETVLGNGDSRQIFQTFKLPKAPLTYHNQVDETPPYIPELHIYVDDRLWIRGPTFFGHGSDEEIYIVREDANGDSWIQFGDGKTGKRLPSGVKNVVALYRTGIGAYGALEEETKVQAGSKLKPLDQIYLPGVVTGGDEPESGDNAREAAPGKVQSLDRLVSLADFESEALAIPGVTKVRAIWGLVSNIPVVSLTVLMENGREAEIETVRAVIARYNRCRGPDRFPVKVTQGAFREVYLFVIVAYDPTYKQELVEVDILEALGVSGGSGSGVEGTDGLFSIRNRQFGGNEYQSRVTGVIQGVEGVNWMEIKLFASPPPLIALMKVIPCDDHQILTLPYEKIKLIPVDAPAAEVC